MGAPPSLALCAQPACGLFGGLGAFAAEGLIGYAAGGVWPEGSWVLWAQYVPFSSLLLATWFHRNKKGNEAAYSGV